MNDPADRPATDETPGPNDDTVAIPQPAPLKAPVPLNAHVLLKSSGDSSLPDPFGRYRLIRQLGSGGMGEVYLADDTQLKRQIALKTPLFKQPDTRDLLERFYREARAAATLRHPHICPVYDVGQIDGRHYISMAYIPGRPLSAFIRPEKPQSQRQILSVIRKLALALQEAHNHGIIHRDLKPSNVIIDQHGEPIIMDFGLARTTYDDDESRLTHSGTVLGTPTYMAPEQVEGQQQRIGPATDQYSLGIILYEMLTGAVPFRGPLMTIFHQILSSPPVPPSHTRPDIDPRVEALCLRMLSKAPEARLPSMKAVADELTRIITDTGRPGIDLGQSADRASSKVDEKTGSVGDARRSTRRSTALWLLIGAAALCAAVALYLGSDGDAIAPVEVNDPDNNLTTRLGEQPLKRWPMPGDSVATAPGTTAAWIDLLARVRPNPRNSHGTWTRTAHGHLRSDKATGWPFPQLVLLSERPLESYELEFGIAFDDADHVILHVPTGTGTVSLLVLRGIGVVAWQEAGPFAPRIKMPESSMPYSFVPAEEYIVHVHVQIDRENDSVWLKGTINEKPLPEFRGYESALTGAGPPPNFPDGSLPGLKDALSLHIGAGFTATLTRARYRPAPRY